MKENEKRAKGNKKIIEHTDYYFENGLMVFTSGYLKRRGYCCGNGCRHCPYQEKEKSDLQ